MTVAVVVLGDLARSPRMLNHARELGARQVDVRLIGYRERDFDVPAGATVAALKPLDRAPDGASKAAFLARSAVRMSLVCGQLVRRLWAQRADAVLVQNPPSFPVLLAVWLATRGRRTRLVFDWHNYGFTMLALRLGAGNVVVQLAERYEGWAGRLADGHFCVSEAMRHDLASRFGVSALTLYDRPLRLPAARRERGAKLVVLYPAGWTADEDVALVLDAFELMTGDGLEVHLTGDGPRRQAFESRIDGARARGFEIHTGYLPEAAYRELLGRADVGLSAHRSSSRLDLAMKVVDLNAAGVPVCALDYGATLREQVEDGVTGRIFRTAAELAAILGGFVEDRGRLERLREGVRRACDVTWGGEWQRVAAPVVMGDR
jgi:beta-1,4-mannosyltransferase